MSADTISLLDGNTFVLSDRQGDIEASPTVPTGLFHMDTRYLSRWVLTLDEVRPTVLSVDDVNYFVGQFFLALPTGTIYLDPSVSVARRRKVGSGFHEDLSIVSHGQEPRQVQVRLEAGADFADLFEVKDQVAKKGQCYRQVRDGCLVLGYRRESYVRETWIRASQPARLDDNGFCFAVQLEPHVPWSTCLEVICAGDPRDTAERPDRDTHRRARLQPHLGTTLEEWLEEAPRLVSSSASLERIYRRSLIDLAALRFFPAASQGGAIPAAGLPWFMAAFGRDSLIASLQALPYVPELARTTLEYLAAQQGCVLDPFRDEEPGKILHEVRFGELTVFAERPQSPYFGSADATPLFLILLDEYERWSGNGELIRRLEPQARAALRWLDEHGDRDGDGYLEYQRGLPTGLENQGWKDSWDAIRFRSGEMAPLPRATCELQGYAYDARVRAARLAREIWNDAALADRLVEQAAALRQRFNVDFWMEERRCFALALSGEAGGKRQVDSLTSNIGHLLWSGIVEPDKAAACVEHLLGDRLFSGWGVRTMAEGEGAYNPIGYHLGTVWPHDNSLIVLGLRRYGYREEAGQLALALLQAAELFAGRLPEVFAGYPRAATHHPVQFPTACSPQAWATATPLLLLSALLGLSPVGEHLLVDPAVPGEITRLELLDIPGRWGRADAFGRGRGRKGRPERAPGRGR